MNKLITLPCITKRSHLKIINIDSLLTNGFRILNHCRRALQYHVRAVLSMLTRRNVVLTSMTFVVVTYIAILGLDLFNLWDIWWDSKVVA